MEIHRVFRSVLALLWLTTAVVALILTSSPMLYAAQAPEQQEQEQEEDEEQTDESEEPEEEEEDPAEGSPVEVHYKDGLRLKSRDDKFSARIRWRSQMRVTDLSSEDLVGEEDGVEEASGFRIRRARFKLDGHAYRPWVRYYLEYGIVASVMLTLQFDLQPSDAIGVRVGQYKVLYNRERVDSSGAQQFADRSIVNNPFTLDRQSGPTAMGRLFEGSWADSRYAGAVVTGTGRGGGLDDDKEPMLIGRWQWNFLKRDLPFSQSDIARRPKPAASLAFAATRNVGRFTRFSSAGGGQLPGFEPGEPGQYELRQWMAEFAYHGRGLSLQSEYHFKRIDDRVNSTVTELEGWYAQAGYFFHEAFDAFPRPLELAVRVARVDSTDGVALPADRELTFGTNWFFNGHNNKITGDVSYLKTTLPLGSEDTGWRARIQWDVSF